MTVTGWIIAIGLIIISALFLVLWTLLIIWSIQDLRDQLTRINNKINRKL